MSSRHIRKLLASNTVPLAEEESEEEFEPLYVNSSTFTYEGLEVSSSSEEEAQTPEPEEDLEESAHALDRTKKKKKRKQRKSKQQPMNVEREELDEIDRSVMEVNAIMGGPPSPPTSPARKPPNRAKELFSVCSKHLNYVNEVKRMLGTETPDEDGKAKKYRPHNVFKYRRACIVPTPENYHFRKIGLTMTLERKEDGLSYFTYDHNRDYQKMHQNFLDLVNLEDVVPIDEMHMMNVHIERLLESADFMFRTEEYPAANKMLEQIISYLQYAAHPAFNITDQSLRLEYQVMENRPFFVAVLKYMYLLSNRACHRTALELAKLLLGLDPSDPLAVIFVIDVLALRAREHQWLIDAVDYWDESRDAKYLFNLKYSYALAHFHITKKNKSEDMSKADELLKEAMFSFPAVTTMILETACHEACARIQAHPMFATHGCDNAEASTSSPKKLRLAAMLYAKLVCWRFREPAVMEWFIRNVNEAVEMFDNDPDVKNRVRYLSIQRQYLFRQCSVEVLRHLLLVRPMANLLVEWDMPRLMRSRAWDPLPPPHTINRYEYGQAEIDQNYYTVLFNLFSTVMQNFIPLELRGVELRHNLFGRARWPAPDPPAAQPPAAPAAAVAAAPALDRAPAPARAPARIPARAPARTPACPFPSSFAPAAPAVAAAPAAPAAPTEAPTGDLTGDFTSAPTGAPTDAPTCAPTGAPTGVQTGAPTGGPTGVPTGAPTGGPTGAPNGAPTAGLDGSSNNSNDDEPDPEAAARLEYTRMTFVRSMIAAVNLPLDEQLNADDWDFYPG